MNYIYQILSTSIVGLISFVTTIFIARNINVESFGLYSTYFSIVSILVVLIDGGMRTYILREKSKNIKKLNQNSNEICSIAFGYSLTIAIVLSLIYTLFTNVKISLIIVFCAWSIVITQYSSSNLRSQGDLKEDAIWLLKNRIITSVFIFVSIFIGIKGSLEILLSFTIGSLLSNFFVKNGFKFNLNLKKTRIFILSIYPTLLTILTIDIATVLYFRSNLIIMKILNISDFLIGQYVAAFKIIESMILLASPIAISVIRNIIVLENTKNLKKYLLKIISLSTLISFLLTITIYFSSEYLVNKLYGKDYFYSIDILKFYSLMILFILPNAVLTQTLLALNQEKFYALLVIFIAFLSITMNFIFIPLYGIFTCIIISILSELILFIVFIVRIKNQIFL